MLAMPAMLAMLAMPAMPAMPAMLAMAAMPGGSRRRVLSARSGGAAGEEDRSGSESRIGG